jgi:hypothetical protein
MQTSFNLPTFKIQVIKYSDFDVSRLRVLETGSIVYEKDGVDRLPAIQSPWLKFNKIL